MEGYSDTLIFHLAAQARVGESWERPYETIDTNIKGTLNLLQSIVDLDLDIAKFDTAGTSEEYGNEGVIELLSHRDDRASRIVSAFVVGDCDDKTKTQGEKHLRSCMDAASGVRSPEAAVLH